MPTSPTRLGPPLRGLLALTAAGALTQAQSYKLNDDFAPGNLESVSGFRLAPSAALALYRTGPGELFCAPLDGSRPPVALAAEVLGGNPEAIAQDYALSPDGAWAVFTTRIQKDRLYSVRADGSAPAGFLHGVLNGAGVNSFQITPDGQRVVYLAEFELDGVLELYCTPIDRSAPPVRLSGTMVAGGDVTHFQLSPDSTRVAYRADQDADEVFDLFAVPLDQSAPPVRLNLSRPLADVEPDFRVSFDSLGVVYRADQDTDGVIELYGASIVGGVPPFKRSAPLIAAGDVDGFALSPVNDWLVYRADASLDGHDELHAVHAISGGAPVRLDGLGGASVTSVALDASGTRAVFRAETSLQHFQLFSVPLDGSTPPIDLLPGSGASLDADYRLAGNRAFFGESLGGWFANLYSAVLDGSAPTVALGFSDMPIQAFLPGADGERVVLHTSSAPYTAPELFTVASDGSTPRPLNERLDVGGVVLDFQLSGDGARVAYLAHQGHGRPELYSVPLTRSTRPRRISAFTPTPPRGLVSAFTATPDGERVLYFARESEASRGQLFSVPADGPERARPVHPLLSGEILDWQIAGGSQRVVFRANSSANGPALLLSSPVDGRGETRMLHPASTGPIDRHQVLADGATVVFASRRDFAGGDDLFRVPADGSQAPSPLHDPLSASEQIQPDFAPAGGRILYRESVFSTGTAQLDLFSLPLDRSTPPVRLSGPLVAGGNVEAPYGSSFLATPDHARVVYVADQDTDEVRELYSVPTDGSAPPVKLNAPLVLAGDVGGRPADQSGFQPFLVSPDSTRVVYVADQDAARVLELYSVPIDGSLPAVRLNAAPVAAGDVGGELHDVQFFHLSPDSSRVVYASDEESNNQIQLYSAPLDGSQPRVRLNPALVTGGDVAHDPALAPAESFRITPDSARVVYLADQDLNDAFELFSVALDGSSPAVRISGPLVPSADVLGDFLLTPDGTRVLFAADRLQDGVLELFEAPVDGSTNPRRVSGPFVASGSLASPPVFALGPDGSRAFYLADQETDGRAELFAGLLSRPLLRSGVPRGLR